MWHPRNPLMSLKTVQPFLSKLGMEFSMRNRCFIPGSIPQRNKNRCPREMCTLFTVTVCIQTKSEGEMPIHEPLDVWNVNWLSQDVLSNRWEQHRGCSTEAQSVDAFHSSIKTRVQSWHSHKSQAQQCMSVTPALRGRTRGSVGLTGQWVWLSSGFIGRSCFEKLSGEGDTTVTSNPAHTPIYIHTNLYT